ncbi:MAG: Zn-ribbon domain-containing OB-fold protein [Syntrophaceae bacterium]|nr:Zn-ribbon domain-containing OB-fold protein [Syntrophaceae bacterium]
MAKKDIDRRFDKFGTVSFMGVSKTNDFIDYLAQGKVMGTRCKACGKSFFPPRADCFNSLASDMEWFEVTGTGTLLTFSTLRYAPVGFEGDLPYTIAVVDYGDYRVFGRIDKSIASPDDELKVGMSMKVVAGKTANDQLTYFFQKA